MTDTHRKKFLFNEIVKADPSKNTEDVYNSNLEDLYYQLVNTGVIVLGAGGGSSDVSGKQDINTTISSNPGGASVRSLNLNYAAATNNPDTFELFIQGVLVSWLNEWGAIRGTSPYTWGDALVRAIRNQGDGITAGNFIELQDRRTGANSNIIYGRRWADGALIRNQLVMADSIVLGPSDPVPAGLPVGTIIYRTT